MTSRTRIGLALLLALAGAAVFAPLLASDLPLYMKGANERAYERARRTLPIAVEEFESTWDFAGLTYEGFDAALYRMEIDAVRSRLDTLASGLPEPQAARLEGFRSEFDTTVSQHRVEGPTLVELARQLVLELELADEDDENGVILEAAASFPLLAALRPSEVFFAGTWIVATVAFLRRGVRSWTRITRGLLLAAALALATGLLAGDPRTVGLKDGLADGSVRATTVVFPPVAFGYAETHLEASLQPPGGEHWLGTDGLGRDVLSRLLHGGRLSLAVGLLTTVLVLGIGVALGALAGLFGGRVDFVFLRVVEVVQSFPSLLLVLAGVALVPAREVHPVVTIAVAIALVRWTGIARLVRGECLRLRELEFTLAARALGFGGFRIAFRHLIPSAMPPVLVAAAFAASDAVLTESAISFLGLGTGPPVPSWGGLIAAERDLDIWWLQLFPGFLVFVTVVACNLVGEGLREALDPRARRERRQLHTGLEVPA